MTKYTNMIYKMHLYESFIKKHGRYPKISVNSEHQEYALATWYNEMKLYYIAKSNVMAKFINRNKWNNFEFKLKQLNCK